MPYSVETFRITPVEDGVPTTTVTLNRTDLEQQVSRPQAGVLTWQDVALEGATPRLAGDDVWQRDVYPLTDWAILPVPSLQLFGGNEGFRPQLSLEFRGTRPVQPTPFRSRPRPAADPRRVLGSRARREPVGQDLPPVRSESARYYAGWDPKLMRLTGDYLFKLTPTPMPGPRSATSSAALPASSTEVLWKPVQQNWGLGAELNYVWQRDFEGLGFGYYDYDVVMGHASLYWDTGWYGLEAQFDAGRYLAGDWGGTFTLQRQFANGWMVGAYVTKTNVSAEEFGEGSFDKGILLDDSAALVDAVRDARRRSTATFARCRATAAPSSTSPTGSIRRCAISTSGGSSAAGETSGSEADLGPDRARGAGRLQQRRHRSDRRGGDGGARRILAGRRGDAVAAAPARPLTRADIDRRGRRRDLGAPRGRPGAVADVCDGAERPATSPSSRSSGSR